MIFGFPSAPGTSLGSSAGMIVTRFTSITENFVICSYRVSEKETVFTGAHSPRSPCYFRLQADIAIWVLRKVRIYTVLTRTWFHFCS